VGGWGGGAIQQFGGANRDASARIIFSEPKMSYGAQALYLRESAVDLSQSLMVPSLEQDSNRPLYLHSGLIKR
jgi:hypothetical protein